MGPFHWRNRILRIEEIKRLQSFPDSFQLAGTVEKQWRQIGNAVPPLLAMTFARAIHQHLVLARNELAA
jgi:DNA (cytosine-5)-methyltransferase 1